MIRSVLWAPLAAVGLLLSAPAFAAPPDASANKVSDVVAGDEQSAQAEEPQTAKNKKAKTGDKPRVLFVTQSKGFTHGSVRRGQELSPAEIAMKQLAQQSGKFTVDCTQESAADFTKKNLQNYDVVMFYTTGDLPIKPEDLDYFFNEWLKQPGHGFIGVHSATDTYHKYEPYWDMVGGTFAGHPWTANSKVTLTVHDTEHPTMKPFGSASVDWTDEIYQYSHWQPEKVRVLMSLDMAKTDIKRPYHVPVAWVKDYGDGRVFTINLGHREDTWQKEPFLDSMLAGILWVSDRIEEGSAEPNPEVSQQEEEKAQVAGANQPNDKK